MRESDRGAASIFVLAVGLVLVAIGSIGATVGAARLARHQARTAADLGALAGAQHAIEGERVACVEAARLVVANSGRMTGCVVSGLEIEVRAEVVVSPAGGVACGSPPARRGQAPPPW